MDEAEQGQTRTSSASPLESYSEAPYYRRRRRASSDLDDYGQPCFFDPCLATRCLVLGGTAKRSEDLRSNVSC